MDDENSAPPRVTFRVNGRVIDVTRVLPLTGRDYKALKAQGVTLRMLGQGDENIEAVFRYACFILQKEDPSVTIDDVEGAPMGAISTFVRQVDDYEKGQVDAPLAKPDTGLSGQATA